MTWSQFIACAATIAFAGYHLARYGDVIAEKTGLGGTWIGVVLVATVTSLPELVTGLSGVILADAPNIAVGDALGSCVFNLALIAFLDFFFRSGPFYKEVSQGHVLSAGFSIMLIGLVVFSLLSGAAVTPQVGHVGIYTPAIIILYLIAIRAVYVQERKRVDEPRLIEKYADITLKQSVIHYAIAAGFVVMAGVAMPFVAIRIASEMGWGQTFVGTMLVAGATSLPEAASTLGALKIRALDLAIGNLFGSNLFNVLILALDDLAYVKAPLLSQVSQAHAIAGVSAMTMTAATIVGLHYQPVKRIFRIAGWVSLALLLVYILNSLVLRLLGH